MAITTSYKLLQRYEKAHTSSQSHIVFFRANLYFPKYSLTFRIFGETYCICKQKELFDSITP